MARFANNTVIGPSILISGRLSGDGGLTVRGRVEGEISLSHTLFVEKSGIVKANVSVKNAIVSGVVVGNIRATEYVELMPGGRMVGDIAAPRVIIVDGASFRGRIEMGDAEVLRAMPGRPTARPVASSVSQTSRFATPSGMPPPARSVYSSSSVQRPTMLTPSPPVEVSTPPSAEASPPEAADAPLPVADAPLHAPLDADGQVPAEKPLPPEPPLFMDVGQRKLVFKKKS